MKQQKGYTKQTSVRLFTVAAAVFLVLGGFALQSFLQLRAAERELEAGYQRALSELAVSLDAMENALQKGRYAISPALAAGLMSRAAGESESAQNALSRLPSSLPGIEQTAGFLSRAGNFADSVSCLADSEQARDENNRQTMDAFARGARKLSEEFALLEDTVRGEKLKLGSSNRDAMRDAELFEGLVTALSSLPARCYEGSFSGYSGQKEPLMLVGKAEVSREEALQAALDFTGLTENQLRVLRQIEGEIPCWVIGGHLDGGELSLEITRRGGMILAMMNTRDMEERILTPQEALEKADAFLISRGYENMQCIGYSESNRSLLAQYVYCQGDALCYPDLIQIGIAPDTGKIVSFEASGYLKNHNPQRVLSQTVLPEDEAVKGLPSDWKTESISLCIILPPGQNERVCYEIICLTGDGTRLRLYLEAETGQEAELLLAEEPYLRRICYQSVSMQTDILAL